MKYGTGWLLALTLLGAAQFPAHAAADSHWIQVDDDDEDGRGWFPFWFGLRMIAPPPVIVQREYPAYVYDYPPPPPPAYPPPTYARPPSAYWYYCRRPAGYYPQVRRCPSGWMQVVPNP